MRNAIPLAVLLCYSLSTGAARTAPPPIERQVLPDGLEVLVVENHSLPLVTLEIAAKNGSMTEPPEYNGLSHLYEHMFFKANQVLPSQEAYMARLRELGMVFNGTTDTERVNYFFTTTSDHLTDAMVFLRDAIVAPRFDPAELDRERVVVTGEIDRNESNPNYFLWHEVEQKLWWKYPSRKDPLGNRKTVLSATPAMMRTIQARYYVPNNSVLVVTGDVKAADIFARATELFASWKRAADPFQKFPLLAHPPLVKTAVVLARQPVESVSGSFNWHGMSSVGKDVELTYAADVLGTAVSDPSSKFQKALVESGACVGASFVWSTQRNTGPVHLGFEAAPEKVDACVKAILVELPKMKSPDYLTDEEIKNAVQRMEVDMARERETPSQLAHVLTFWWASAGLDYYLGYTDGLKKATRAEMARFLDAYVLGKPYVFGVLASPEMAATLHLDVPHFDALLGLPVEKPGEPASSTASAKHSAHPKKTITSGAAAAKEVTP